MRHKYVIAFTLLFLLLLIYYQNKCTERFESNKDKAKFITNWFEKTKKRDYSTYKDEVPQSDIIEYSKIKQLNKQGNLNYNSVENMLK